MKLGRNDLCWCGSKNKYKQCHATFDEKLKSLKKEGYKTPSRNIIKNEQQLNGIRKAGKLNTEILDMIGTKVCSGMSTDDINTLVHEYTISHGGIPAPLNYEGFPKSVCTSLNHVICHGIPSPDDVLKEGDIVNIDVTTILDGFYADASRMFCIGTVSTEAQALVDTAKKALDLAVAHVKPWTFLGDIGEIISTHVYSQGYTVLHDIGGHGIGIDFHEDPYVCHVGTKGTGMILVPGMVFTIEPMVNMGKEDFYQDKLNGWTIYTKDGSLSAQWEYTIAVTEDGVEIITH